MDTTNYEGVNIITKYQISYNLGYEWNGQQSGILSSYPGLVFGFSLHDILNTFREDIKDMLIIGKNKIVPKDSLYWYLTIMSIKGKQIKSKKVKIKLENIREYNYKRKRII